MPDVSAIAGLAGDGIPVAAGERTPDAGGDAGGPFEALVGQAVAGLLAASAAGQQQPAEAAGGDAAGPIEGGSAATPALTVLAPVGSATEQHMAWLGLLRGDLSPIEMVDTVAPGEATEQRAGRETAGAAGEPAGSPASMAAARLGQAFQPSAAQAETGRPEANAGPQVAAAPDAAGGRSSPTGVVVETGLSTPTAHAGQPGAGGQPVPGGDVSPETGLGTPTGQDGRPVDGGKPAPSGARNVAQEPAAQAQGPSTPAASERSGTVRASGSPVSEPGGQGDPRSAAREETGDRTANARGATASPSSSAAPSRGVATAVGAQAGSGGQAPDRTSGQDAPGPGGPRQVESAASRVDVPLGGMPTEGTGPAAQAAESAAPRPALFDQVVRGIRLAQAEGRSDVYLQLDPPSLGELHIRLTIQDGHVRVHLHTPSGEVKGMLDGALAQLRQALTDQGLRVDGLAVSLGQGGAAGFGANTGGPGHGAAARPELSDWWPAEVEAAVVAPHMARPSDHVVDYRV